MYLDSGESPFHPDIFVPGEYCRFEPFCYSAELVKFLFTQREFFGTEETLAHALKDAAVDMATLCEYIHDVRGKDSFIGERYTLLDMAICYHDSGFNTSAWLRKDKETGVINGVLGDSPGVKDDAFWCRPVIDNSGGHGIKWFRMTPEQAGHFFEGWTKRTQENNDALKNSTP